MNHIIYKISFFCVILCISFSCMGGDWPIIIKNNTNHELAFSIKGNSCIGLLYRILPTPGTYDGPVNSVYVQEVNPSVMFVYGVVPYPAKSPPCANGANITIHFSYHKNVFAKVRIAGRKDGKNWTAGPFYGAPSSSYVKQNKYKPYQYDVVNMPNSLTKR